MTAKVTNNINTRRMTACEVVLVGPDSVRPRLVNFWNKGVGIGVGYKNMTRGDMIGVKETSRSQVRRE